jgi:hypothetical protein
VKVTVTRRELGSRRAVGDIEFRGIMTSNADGSAHVPVDAEGKQIPFSFECKPPGLVLDASARRIADDLSWGIGKGNLSKDEWHAD